MSIGPVQNQAAVSEPADSVRVRAKGASPPAHAPESAVEFHLRARSSESVPSGQRSPLQANAAGEEVQVQRDPLGSGQIVVRYVNRATGDLILQVPSNQVLSVARGINEEFQRAARDEQAASIADHKVQKHER